MVSSVRRRSESPETISISGSFWKSISEKCNYNPNLFVFSYDDGLSPLVVFANGDQSYPQYDLLRGVFVKVFEKYSFLCSYDDSLSPLVVFANGFIGPKEIRVTRNMIYFGEFLGAVAHFLGLPAEHNRADIHSHFSLFWAGKYRDMMQYFTIVSIEQNKICKILNK